MKTVRVGRQQHGEEYLSEQKRDPDVRFILDFFSGLSCICIVVVIYVYMKVLLNRGCIFILSIKLLCSNSSLQYPCGDEK